MAASLTVTRSVVEIQNLLICDVCKKTINEPKILPCSHSFCKACLENFTTQDEENVDGEGKKLDCPTCTSTVTLKAKEKVTGLPDNELIVKLLTAVGPDRKQETAVCSLGHSEPSITICMECEMLLCHTCCCSHYVWPANKNHIMVSISEIINRDEQQVMGAETLSCSQHKDAIPKFYCETCKELICIKCLASVHTKPDHTCVAIHEVFRKQQDAVKSKCATINAIKLEGTKALETVINSRATYEKTAKDTKVKHTIQKNKIMKTVTDAISKILDEKITEVDNVYDPPCQKLSVQAGTISNYLEKVEKCLHRTNEVLKNSKLQELIAAQQIIDDDIQMLQNEKPQNLTSFQVQVENPESCMKKLCPYTIFMELARDNNLENVRQRTHEIDGHKLEISDKPIRARPVPKKQRSVPTPKSKEIGEGKKEKEKAALHADLAEIVSQGVQWFYVDPTNEELEEYDKRTNATIEKAYGKKKKSVIFSLQDGRCEIIFDKMEETNLDTNQKLKVIRKDLKADVSLPEYWETQPVDTNGKELDVHLVTLDPKNHPNEYKKIHDHFNQTASNQRILQIQRIQNPSLLKLYLIKKQSLDDKNDSNEKFLFHGTRGDILNTINKKGLNRSYAGNTNGVVYGKGVYFARDASMSAGYASAMPDGKRYMYYTRVAVGQYAVGNSSMLVPPAKGGNSNDSYDSVVNNVTNPTIFVLFFDNQYYPEYLITFK